MEERPYIDLKVASNEHHLADGEHGLSFDAAMDRAAGGAGRHDKRPSERLSSDLLGSRNFEDRRRNLADFVGHTKTLRLNSETFNPFHDFGSFVRIKRALHKRNVGYTTPLAVCQNAD